MVFHHLYQVLKIHDVLLEENVRLYSMYLLILEVSLDVNQLHEHEFLMILLDFLIHLI
jgi:hypothetical protein